MSPDPAGPQRHLRPAAALSILLVAALALHGPTTWPDGAALADLALLALLLAALRQRRLVAPAGPLLALAAGIVALSTALAADRWAALSGVTDLARLVLAFWAGCSLAGSAAGVLAFLAASGALAAVHGALQVLVLHPRLLRELGPESSLAPQLADGRANSVFLLPAHLGSWCAMALCASVALAMSQRGLRRAGAVLAAAASAGGIVAAGSFGGVALAGAGLALLVLATLRGRLRRALLAAMALACVAIVVVSFARRRDEVSREGPWTARARNWAVAARLVREAPWTGHGAGSFGAGHARLRQAAGNDARHAHQAYLQAAAEHGAAMLALLAIFVGAFAARAAPARRGVGGEGADATGAGLFAAGSVALLAGLIDFPWSLGEWAIPAAIVLGAGWMRGRDAPGAAALPRGRLAWAAVGACALALVAFDAARGIAGRLDERAIAAARVGDHARARALLRRARALAPGDDAVLADSASAALALARQEPAAREAWLAEAEALARRSVAASPNEAARHGLLSQVLNERGETASAAAEALRASQLAPHAPEWTAWRDAMLARLAPGAAP